MGLSPGHPICPGHCHLYLSVLFLPTWVFSPPWLLTAKVNTFSASTGNDESYKKDTNKQLFWLMVPIKKGTFRSSHRLYYFSFTINLQGCTWGECNHPHKNRSLILWLLLSYKCTQMPSPRAATALSALLDNPVLPFHQTCQYGMGKFK